MSKDFTPTVTLSLQEFDELRKSKRFHETHAEALSLLNESQRLNSYTTVDELHNLSVRIRRYLKSVDSGRKPSE